MIIELAAMCGTLQSVPEDLQLRTLVSTTHQYSRIVVVTEAVQTNGKTQLLVANYHISPVFSTPGQKCGSRQHQVRTGNRSRDHLGATAAFQQRTQQHPTHARHSTGLDKCFSFHGYSDFKKVISALLSDAERLLNLPALTAASPPCIMIASSILCARPSCSR